MLGEMQRMIISNILFTLLRLGSDGALLIRNSRSALTWYWLFVRRRLALYWRWVNKSDWWFLVHVNTKTRWRWRFRFGTHSRSWRRMLRAAARCPKCVDLMFTDTWANRLADESDAIVENPHMCLSDHLSILPCTSSRVKRKHLLPQATKPTKRKRAKHGTIFQRLTYRLGVTANAAKLQAEATRRCIGTDPKIRRRFLLAINSHHQPGRVDRRSNQKSGDIDNANDAAVRWSK